MSPAPPSPRRMRAAAAAAVLLAAAFARADVVHLRDGSKLGGTVLSDGPRLVRLRTSDGSVRTLRVEDVARIERGVDLDAEADRAALDARFMPGLDEAARKEVRRAAARYETQSGRPLDAAARPHAWVFGDQPQDQLLAIANAVERTCDDFATIWGCELRDVLPTGGSGDPGRLHVFQYRDEEGYRRFVDKVLERIRDETVDDARLALIRRQRGFWILSPRPILARYQGPSTLTTLVSNASHETSHALLMLYRPSGAWMPWWFLEGVASWQEIRLTERNLTYCIDVPQPGGYAQDATPDADEAAKAKTAEKWRRDVKARVRARGERDLEQLGRLTLNEIVLEDVQQSWSFVDWLHRTERLVRFTAAYKEGRTLEAACRTVFEKEPAGVHEAWRAWVLANY